MPSPFYLGHVSTGFVALLAASVLYGLVRAGERGLTRSRRAARAFWTPLFFFVAVMVAAHAASFAPPSSRFAMALAVLSPAHREKVARKLRPRVLAETKTDETVRGLLELDRVAFGCPEAVADASLLRADGAWARIDAACGPSVASATAAYHDGRLADAANQFSAARARSSSKSKATVEELSSLLLLDRRSDALALVRSEKREPGPAADALGCLEDALVLYAENRSGPLRHSLSGACYALGGTFASEHAAARDERPLCTRHVRPRRAPPCAAGCIESGVPDPIASLRNVAGPSFFGRERIAKAAWLVRVARAKEASALFDEELLALGTAEPLYPSTLVAARERFLDDLVEEVPGSVFVDEDCFTKVALPPGHPRAKEAHAFDVRYDERRDAADRGRLFERDEVLARAATAALDAGDLARAEGYIARRTSAPLRSSTLALRHAFSRADAGAALYGREHEAFESAVAGDGAALARDLRAIGGSGVGTIDVVGATIPLGRDELRAYSRHEARLRCHEGVDNVACGPGALAVALGGRVRVARAVGDERTAKESQEAIARLLAAPGRWVEEPRLFALTYAAQEILRDESDSAAR